MKTWKDDNREELLVGIYPQSKYAFVVYYFTRQNKWIRSRVAPTQSRYNFNFVSQLIKPYTKLYKVSVYMEHFDPAKAFLREVDLINRLPLQRKKRAINPYYPQPGVKNQWSVGLPFGRKVFMRILRELRYRRISHWIIGRETWQKWFGLTEYLEDPKYGEREYRAIIRATMKHRWPDTYYHKIRKHKFMIPILLITYVLDRKEVYFHYGDTEELRVR